MSTMIRPKNSELENLRALFLELDFKTPLENVTEEQIPWLQEFLANERKLRHDFRGNIRVLCIDELGYTQQNKDAGDLLFQIIAKRSETLPTIITTNLPPKQWGSIFAGPAATAMLDRLNYNGKFITMDGASYRMGQRKK